MTHAAAVKEVSAAAEVGDGGPARWEGDRPGQRPHYQSTVANQGRPDAVQKKRPRQSTLSSSRGRRARAGHAGIQGAEGQR